MSQLPVITEASEKMRTAQIEPIALTERCLEAIDRHEKSIRAWVVVASNTARRDAERIAADRSQGEEIRPLCGIPIGIKDIVDVAGLPTRAGYFCHNNQAALADAPLVARLRRAGAILLGKTVTTQYACFDPSPTRNPWDPQLRHSPGGSSSGSAAAVAAGMCLAAIGTQTGGSLVRPASFCGVAAMKPTFGTVPMEGVVPVSRHLDQAGPIARTVEDLYPLLRIISDLPEEDLLEPTSPPRLGLVREFFLEQAEPRVREATNAAMAMLSSAGAALDDVALPPGFEQVHRMHRRIMAFEAAAFHRPQFLRERTRYGPNLRSMLDEADGLSLGEYRESLVYQRRFRRHVETMFATVDALIMPATDTTAPARLDTTGDSKFQAPWSLAGVPVVSFACGLADNHMPVALQVVGRKGEDYRVLGVARWCERQVGFTDLPPLIAQEAARTQ